MANDDGLKPDKYEVQLKQAIDDLRGNAKWALVAFGAIGTTLLAGSQLSNLGKFQTDNLRLWAAVLFAVLALGAATYAVRSAMAVAYTGSVELYNLEEADIAYLARNPAILEGFGSLDNLKQRFEEAIAWRYAALVRGESTADMLERYEHWYEYLDGVVDKVLAYIRYNSIKTQSERSRHELTAASIVAAIGLVGFAWAANPAVEHPIVVLKALPSEARLALTSAGKTTLAPVLGTSCVALDRIEVIVLNATTAGSEVVTAKTKDCPIVRFTVSDTLGKLAATSP